MKRVLIHIGTEKTGTTSIQEFLHVNRSQLAKQGVAYLKTPGLKNNRKLVTYCMSDDYIDDHVKDLGIATPGLRQQWKQQFRKEITEEIEGLPSNIHSVVISSEHFHSRFRYEFEVENLFKFLKPFFSEFKIIVYLRRQDEMAVSLYSTLCRNGWSRESIFPEYVSPEDHYYNYFGMLERWSKVFGQDNLILRIFEKSKLDKRDIISDFLKSSDMIEVDPDFKIPKIQNESLSSIAQDVLISFNKNLPKYEVNAPNHFFNFLRNKLVDNLQANYRSGPKLPTREESMKFYNLFRQSNQKLSEKFFEGTNAFSEDFSRYSKTVEAQTVNQSTLDIIFHTIQSCLQALPPLSEADIKQLSRQINQIEQEHAQADLLSTAAEMYEQAKRLHQEGRLEDAIVNYRRAITLQPDCSDYYEPLGDALAAQKKWADAIATYQTAISLKSDNLWIHYKIGFALAVSGSWSQAAKSYQTAFSAFPQIPPAVFSLDQYQSHADSYELHFKLGEFWVLHKNLSRAILALQNCVEINPDFTPAYETLAQAFCQTGRRDEASQTYLGLGEAFCRAESLDRALVAFQESTELNPNSCWAHNCLGNAYFWKGDLENAILSYERAVELKPDLTTAYQQLGDIFSSQGDIDKATAFYDLALKSELCDRHPEMV